MPRYALCPLLVALLLVFPGWVVAIPVIDVSAIAQLVTEYKLQVMQYAEQMEQTKNQIDQIRNQIQQIQYAYTTVQHGITNLATLDLNKAADLLTLTQQLQRKLTQAEYIGYQVQQAASQAQKIYPRIQGIMDADQQRTLYLQWASAQRASASVAIQTQAIQDSQARYQQQWADILNRAYQAQGNLQIQQAAVQAQGVMGHQLLSIEQHLATQAREQSERAMQEASRIELEQTAIQHITSTYDTTYQARGQILSMPRTGRE